MIYDTNTPVGLTGNEQTISMHTLALLTVKVMLIVSFSFLASLSVLAADKTTSGNATDWNDPDAWQPYGVPSSWHIVEVAHDLTFSGSINTIHLGALNVKTGGSLTVTEDLELYSGIVFTIELGARLDVLGSITSPGFGSVWNWGDIVVQNDIALASGSTLVNRGSVVVKGNGVLSSSYNLDNSGGIFQLGKTLSTTNWTNSILNLGGTLNVGRMQLGTAVTVIGGTTNVLPVEMMYFSVIDGDGCALLEWGTASEKDNDYYEIQVSGDGINFTSTGQVDGQGTVSDVTEYQFQHCTGAAGIVYYRLKQVDYDGTQTYSDIVKFEHLQASELELYPTVLSSGDYLIINAESETDVLFVSSTGTIQQTISLEQGMNYVPLDLEQGMYIVNANGQNKNILIR